MPSDIRAHNFGRNSGIYVLPKKSGDDKSRVKEVKRGNCLVLIEKARVENHRRLLATGFDMLRINVTRLSLDQRRVVLDQWFSYHLRCVDGKAHRWASHRWLPMLRSWFWGACEKCGVSRLTQTTGNTIVWHQEGTYFEALIMNKDFDKLERVLSKLWEAVWVDEE